MGSAVQGVVAVERACTRARAQEGEGELQEVPMIADAKRMCRYVIKYSNGNKTNQEQPTQADPAQNRANQLLGHSCSGAGRLGRAAASFQKVFFWRLRVP
jgi:hypothetical protein